MFIYFLRHSFTLISLGLFPVFGWCACKHLWPPSAAAPITRPSLLHWRRCHKRLACLWHADTHVYEGTLLHVRLWILSLIHYSVLRKDKFSLPGAFSFIIFLHHLLLFPVIVVFTRLFIQKRSSLYYPVTILTFLSPNVRCETWAAGSQLRSKAPQPPPKPHPTSPTCPHPHPGPTASPSSPTRPVHRTQRPPSPTNRETLEGRSASPILVSPPLSSGYQRHLLTTYQAVLSPLKSMAGVQSGGLVCCGVWKMGNNVVTS